MLNKIKLLLLLMIRSILKLLPERWLVTIRKQIEYMELIKKLGNKTPNVKSNSEKIKKRVESSTSKHVHVKEKELVGTIMLSYKVAKQQQSFVSRPFQPSDEWEKIFTVGWKEYQYALSRNDGNKMALLLGNFFRNEGISGFWGNNDMYLNFCKTDSLSDFARADGMMKQYNTWRNLCPSTPLTFLEAPDIGNPWGYSIENVLLFEPVFEYHFQAHYLSQLLDKLSSPVVLEIGGGFGGLAYFLRKINPSIKYIGFDLPENILLQTYYLSSAFPEAKIFTYDKNFTKLDSKILSSYDIILLPNFTIPDVESAAADLIINVRSLAEMSIDTITAYLNELDRIGRLFFFHENIYKQRLDGLHGITSDSYPGMSNFFTIASSESKWPKYKNDSVYPCQENLLIHKDVINNFLSIRSNPKNQ